MAFTEAQEKVIKDSLPDLYKQIDELYTQLSTCVEKITDLTERLESMENWRRALRLRIRQEGSAT